MSRRLAVLPAVLATISLAGWLGCWLGLADPVAAQPLNPNHECSFCHDMHDAPGFDLTNEVDVEVLCLTCHGPAGISKLKAEVHSNRTPNSSYDPFRVTCVTCHDSHDGEPNRLGPHLHDGMMIDGINIKLVGRVLDADRLAKIDTVEWDESAGDYTGGRIRDVVFEFLGGSEDETHGFLFNDPPEVAPFDGACQVCHSQTDHHCNDDLDNTGDCDTDHNPTLTCTDCHSHADGFNF